MTRYARTSAHGHLAVAAAGWLTGYGGLQAWWATGHRPSFGPLGTDLLTVPGWASVLSCVAGAALAVSFDRSGRPSRWRRAGAVTVAVVLAIACPFLLLDVVGLLIPGLGLPFDLTAFLSRAGCLTGAVLLVAAVQEDRRRWSACRGCSGDAWAWPGLRWMRYAAGAAVVGCAVRLAAQLVEGMNAVPYPAGPATILFEIGFVLAGVALPLALLTRRARRMPRWVLLLPAASIATGLVCYFGTGLIQLAAEVLAGTATDVAFMATAMGGYLLWGLGLGVAALGYARVTRRPCPVCGRSQGASEPSTLAGRPPAASI